jgi:hypothetical protein
MLTMNEDDDTVVSCPPTGGTVVRAVLPLGPTGEDR